tara:strand:- start:362 stop:484 length:123 start_codon:yes stop_codon:yes gene_type:complete
MRNRIKNLTSNAFHISKWTSISAALMLHFFYYNFVEGEKA